MPWAEVVRCGRDSGVYGVATFSYPPSRSREVRMRKPYGIAIAVILTMSSARTTVGNPPPGDPDVLHPVQVSNGVTLPHFDEGIDLVFLGDGYQQRTVFEADVKSFGKALFDNEVFSEKKDKF